MNIKKYIESTGSTWYLPKNKELEYFNNLKNKGVLVEENGYYTLPYIRNMEEKIASHIISHLHTKENKTKYPKNFLDIYISLFETKEGITLDEWQREAVYMAVNNNLFILTGGPGTGKTCVLKCIYYILKNVLQYIDILFTAPTGKAARRITESVNVNAYTVAKVLELGNPQKKPKKIKNQVMIIDEVSMLDTETAHALFTSLSQDTILILVGDVEQLPSVGYGSVLRDLIDTNIIPCVKLEKTFRQASESGLFANIEQIKKGLHLGFIEREDFKVLTVNNIQEAQNAMLNEFLSAISKYGIDNVVCLTPYRRKGPTSAIKMNTLLQDLINPECQGKNYVTTTIIEEDNFQYELRLREGDIVMQLVNREQIANGDIGKVKEINVEKKYVLVKYIDCEVRYSPSELGQLCLAYAMSIHKSQGSEYKTVITSVLDTDMAMLSRNTIYTAVTRAKQNCIIITNNKNVAQKACERESGYERTTRLCEKIQMLEEKYTLLKHLFNERK